MRVGLFIPCYIDQFYPQVGIATFELLEKLNVEVEYPLDQTCCGQPMANSGYEKDSLKTASHFVSLFHEFDYIVAPSGSCVLHVKEHFHVLRQDEKVKKVRESVIELTQFLNQVLQLKTPDGRFPHKVGIHHSCHGQRGLRLAQSSERVGDPFSMAHQLLSGIKEIELVELQRADECCGFGGTFSVSEPEISTSMGDGRIQDHLEQGAEIITGGDVSCLMHLEGLIKRQKLPIKTMHIAEILNQVY